ncbi:hypothetical protein WN50_39440, partial [Limnoraphis robusta CS-951]
ADIKGAFDNISHEFTLKAIGEIPGRELIKQWLKAGYVESEIFHETESGTPKGVRKYRRPELRQVFRGAFRQQRAIKSGDPGRVRPPVWGLVTEEIIEPHIETMKPRCRTEPGSHA